MTTDSPAMTAGQIRARLDEIAPWPGWGGTPATPEAVARYLAMHAGLGHARNVTPFITNEQEIPAALICAQFAAVHALMALAEENPGRAAEVAQEIAEDWNGGGGLGMDLWGHMDVLGMDPGELIELDAARLALENADRAPAAEADQSLADRMAATEAAIRASERELVALELAGLKDALRRHLPSFTDPNNGEAVCGGCLEPSPCPDAALLGEEATS